MKTDIEPTRNRQYEHSMDTNPNLRMRPVDQCRELRIENTKLKESLSASRDLVTSYSKGFVVRDQEIDKLTKDFDIAKSIALSAFETSENLMDECAKRGEQIKELRAIIDSVPNVRYIVSVDPVYESAVSERIEELEAELARSNRKVEDYKVVVNWRDDQIAELKSSDSATVGNLRNINVRLHRTMRSQDDIICGMVNEIDELQTKIDTKDKALVVAREIIQILEHKLAASERANEITEQAIKSAERALVEKDAEIHELKECNKELVKRNDSLRDQYMLDQKTIEHLDADIDKLKDATCKLVDRERQFNELDAIHERTRGMLAASGRCIKEQNTEIDGLKAELADSKDHSTRLKEVADVVKDWTDDMLYCESAMSRMYFIVKGCFDGN